MSYQNFPNQPPSAGSAGGPGVPYPGVNGAPDSGGYPGGYQNSGGYPGGYPGGYQNPGGYPGGYPNPGNGAAAYGQGYYYNPGRNPNASDKSRLVALLLAWFLGVFGAHRFYVGKTGTAVAMIFTIGGLGVWALVDFIMIAAGSFTDIDGRPITVWDTAN